MRKIAAVLLCFCLILPSVCVFALADEYILSDPVRVTYNGRPEAHEILQNLGYADVEPEHWASEAIVSGGAFNLIKGFGDMFYPGADITKKEALTFVLRALGYEKVALAQAPVVAETALFEADVDVYIDLSYIYFASAIGIISAQDYIDALDEEALALVGQTLPPGAFRKNDPATREEVANWIYLGFQSIDKTLWENPESVQRIYSLTDWYDISAWALMPVETMLRNGIMDVYNGYFFPKGTVVRAEMALILKNLESIYFNLVGIEKKTGTVGAFDGGEASSAAEWAFSREILIRSADGYKDVLMYSQEASTAPANQTLDAVIYKDGTAAGLLALEEGDVIEYYVETATDTVMYVRVLGEAAEVYVSGALASVDVPGRTIVIAQSDGSTHAYSFAEGMGILDMDEYYIVMDSQRINVNQLPVGSLVGLTLTGGVVVSASYIGEPVIIQEAAGIVIENDPDFGFLTILDNTGSLIVRRYYENDLVVEKRGFYDISGSVGYISQLFPHFGYNPRQSTISQIEPGDIVYFRVYDDYPDVIESISAATDYTVKYGKVRQIRINEKFTEMLVEYENNQTAWFSIANGVYASKQGRAAGVSAVQVGDWVKLLVNEAVLAPGYVMDTVKEVTIEGPEHYVSAVIKGGLAGLDRVQNQLKVQNAQMLSKTGWTNYKNLATFSLNNKDIEFYNGNERISLDTAVKYFTRSDATVYIALENSYTGERVKKVTFRFERDEPLKPDTVISATGGGAFRILSSEDEIGTDSGTIVVRHGRLVTGLDIYASDYTRVVMNGGGTAAVVDISDAPDISKLMISRGRIASVDDGVSFKVQSLSILTGTSWIYTPIQREFAIDYNTLFLNEAGYVEPDTFISYTENTVIERVYNIVADGSRAAFVVEAPYASRAIRGTVYQVENGVVYIKDAFYQDEQAGTWRAVSLLNSTVAVNLSGNTVIGKNNVVIRPEGLEAGDSVTVFTNIIPDVVEGGMGVNGYIILVIN